MSSPSGFHDPAFAVRYESWYGTPYGRMAEALEREHLLELLGPLEAGDRVLDIGCGTGHFAAIVAEAGAQVVGVDRSAAMLGPASRRVPVVRADGLRLPFASGAFDHAFMCFVLEFTSGPLQLLREARRVACERVVVLTLASGSWLSFARRVAAWRGHAVFGSLRRRSRSQLVELGRGSGAEPFAARGLLYLPPRVAGRLPQLERRLSGGRLPGAGVIGFAIPGGADDSGLS